MKNKKRITAFSVINTIIMIGVIFVTLFPFIYIISVSTSETSYVIANKVTFYPIGFNLDAYFKVANQPIFWTVYKNSIVYTVLGTIVSLFMTVICAYPLSKKYIPGIKLVTAFIVFTMFFNGGIIPTYMLVKGLGMRNSIASIILTPAINTWNLLVMRTFFQGIPESLEEAARVDGLNPIQTMLKIVLPLSKSILATIGLFYAVSLWNSWFPALIYLDETRKYPVSLFLRNILMGADMAARNGIIVDESSQDVIPTTLRMASIVLTTLPILCIYPFVQRYFVKGMLIGAIKA